MKFQNRGLSCNVPFDACSVFLVPRGIKPQKGTFTPRRAKGEVKGWSESNMEIQ